MKSNDIIYADLSTYRPNETTVFYESVFGWKFYKEKNDYFAYKGNTLVAGLYETPEKFKQMRMPHFWMTYMRVDNVANTIAKARELGGIIEADLNIEGFGKLALIRDPQGAGFTVYEGSNLKKTRTQNKEDTLIWNELHVSEVKNIIPFYKGIFDWSFEKKEDDRYEIHNGRQGHTADVLEIPNTYKGKYEYWVCTFGVKDLQKKKDTILKNGGNIVSDEGERILTTDNSGEAFFYIREVK